MQFSCSCKRRPLHPPILVANGLPAASDGTAGRGDPVLSVFVPSHGASRGAEQVRDQTSNGAHRRFVIPCTPIRISSNRFVIAIVTVHLCS